MADKGRRGEERTIYEVGNDSGTFCGGGGGGGVYGSDDAALQQQHRHDAGGDFNSSSAAPSLPYPSNNNNAYTHPHAAPLPPQAPSSQSHPPPLHAPDQFGSHTMEAFLRPQLPRDVSVHTALTSTDFSEESSSLMTDDGNGA